MHRRPTSPSTMKFKQKKLSHSVVQLPEVKQQAHCVVNSRFVKTAKAPPHIHLRNTQKNQLFFWRGVKSGFVHLDFPNTPDHAVGGGADYAHSNELHGAGIRPLLTSKPPRIAARIPCFETPACASIPAPARLAEEFRQVGHA